MAMVVKGTTPRLLFALFASTVAFFTALYLLLQGKTHEWDSVGAVGWGRVGGFQSLHLPVRPLSADDVSRMDWDEELRKATRTTPERKLPNGLPGKKLSSNVCFVILFCGWVGSVSWVCMA